MPADSAIARVLGIDVGTGKVAAVLTDAATGAVTAHASCEHRATVPGLLPGHDEQDVPTILATVRAVLHRLPAAERAACRAVGVTGQMHGVAVLGADGRPLSHLVTWQDQRGQDPGFLQDLAERAPAAVWRTGYGGTTLAWLRARGQLPPGAAAAGTIHDCLVAVLCGQPRPLTDPTDAASWGLLDTRSGRWQTAAATAAGIPLGLLPELRPCGSVAGQVVTTAAAEYGLAAGLPVTVAIGDNQASLLATLADHAPESALALTLGTGGQLSAVMPADFVPPAAPPATFEYRPYPGGRVAAVAAALAGGSAFAWLVESVRGWCRDLGLPEPAADGLYARLSELGLASDGAGLAVTPCFLGERHDPARRGRIDGLTLTNASLGALSRALARGLVANLSDMLPPECFEGRRVVVGSGNALRRLPLLQACAREVLGLPLELPPACEEAATGAARLARQALG